MEGYRRQPAVDTAALEAALLRVWRLVEEIPAIAEPDCNPVFALPADRGCRIVDARIRVDGGQSEPNPLRYHSIANGRRNRLQLLACIHLSA